MRLLYITIIALFFISCSPTKELQGRLSKYKQPIGYLHDSKLTDCPKSDSLKIMLNNNAIDSFTTVSLIYKHTRYWVLYASNDIKMNVNLGQSSIQKQYNDFFLSSLIDESKRTGCFEISNSNSNNSQYILEIKMDTCKTDADYRYKITNLLGLMRFNINGYPSKTNLQISAKLKKNSDLISEKKYIVKREQPFLNKYYVSFDKLEADFMVNMVESLSLGTKQCIEEIINDINGTIQNK